MALLPVLAMVRVLKIGENATNYSIDKTAPGHLAPTTAEMKYRTKPATTAVRAARRRMAALTVPSVCRGYLRPGSRCSGT
jgi:hypothetical protein